MSKIILTAENFAFGPISKLLFIADLLHKRNHSLHFVGYGTSLQLAKRFPFDEIHELDTDSESSQEALDRFISSADILVSSMDIRSIAAAQKLQKPAIWIDCLFWFWENIPEVTHNVDAYIRELTVNDSKNEHKFREKISNFYTVGPIIGQPKVSTRRKQALISFGGGEASYWYKVGKDTNYPFVMTSLLDTYVEWSYFEKVLLASNENIIKQLREKLPNTAFTFTTLSQDDFVEELSRSEVLLTTAGLVTTQSAFQQRTPTLFLPSSNNSHYLLLEEFRRLQLAPASIQLSDFTNNEITIEGIPPHESMKAVMQSLRELENSEDLQKKVGEKINTLLKNRGEWADKQILGGGNYLTSLGGNGAETAVDIIETVLEKKTVYK